MDSPRTSPGSSATALTPPPSPSPPPATALDLLETATRLKQQPGERVCDTPLSRRSVSPVDPSVGNVHSTRAQHPDSQAEEQLVEQYSLHSFDETGELQVVGRLAKTTKPGKKKKRKRKTKGKTTGAPVTPQPHPRRKTCAQPGEKKPLPASGSDQKEVVDPVKTPDTLEESVEAGLRDVSKMPRGSQKSYQSKEKLPMSKSKEEKILRALSRQERQVLEELFLMKKDCLALFGEFNSIKNRLNEAKNLAERLALWEDSTLEEFHLAANGLHKQFESFLQSNKRAEFERQIFLQMARRTRSLYGVSYFSDLFYISGFFADYYHRRGEMCQELNCSIIAARIIDLCSPEGKDNEEVNSSLIRAVSSLLICTNFVNTLKNISENKINLPREQLELVPNLVRISSYSIFKPFLDLLEVSERSLAKTCSVETIQEKTKWLKKNIAQIMLSFSRSPVGKDFLKFAQSGVEAFDKPTERFEIHSMRYIALTLMKAPVADTLPTLDKIKTLVNPEGRGTVDLTAPKVKQLSLNMATASIDRCSCAVAYTGVSSSIDARYSELKDAIEPLKSFRSYWHSLFGNTDDMTYRDKARQFKEVIAKTSAALQETGNRIKVKFAAADKMAKKLIGEVAGEAENEARVQKVKHRPYLAKPGKIISTQKEEQPRQEKPIRREIQENWQHLDNAITLLNSLGDKYDQLGECIRLFRIVDNRQAENVTAEQKAFALYGLYSVSLFNTRNTFKDIRPNMTFLSRYHETLLRGENPSVSDGGVFLSTLDTYKKGLEKYKTLLKNTQGKLNHLVKFTFYSDNNLIEDEELLESISEAQAQCTNAVMEVRRFSEKLSELCRLRKKMYKGIKRIRPRQPAQPDQYIQLGQPVQPPGPVQLDQPVQPPGPAQLGQLAPDSSDSKKIQCLLEQIQEASNSLTTSQEHFSEVCTKLSSLVSTAGPTVSV